MLRITHISTAVLLVSCLAVTGQARAEEAEEAPAEESDPAEDNRFDWLVLSAEAGYRALNIRKVKFDEDSVNPKIVPSQSRGFSPALGIGVRLWFVGVMIRADGGTMRSSEQGLLDNNYQLWNLDLEVSFRAHVGRVEPYVLLGGGLSTLGGFKSALKEVGQGIRATGANARVGLGLDVFVTEWLTVGGRADVGAVILTSKGTVADLVEPEQVDTLNETEDRLRDADGSLVGVAYGATLTCGLHF